MRSLADADTSSMTPPWPGVRPHAGDVRPGQPLERAHGELFGLIRDVLRPDLELHDVSLVFELVAAIEFADPGRIPVATGTWRSSWTAWGP